MHLLPSSSICVAGQNVDLRGVLEVDCACFSGALKGICVRDAQVGTFIALM